MYFWWLTRTDILTMANGDDVLLMVNGDDVLLMVNRCCIVDG
jgi:hypothetical protein